MTCPNCQTVLTCGCQKRTTSRNTEACVNCLARAEAAIANQKPTQQLVFANPAQAR